MLTVLRFQSMDLLFYVTLRGPSTSDQYKGESFRQFQFCDDSLMPGEWLQFLAPLWWIGRELVNFYGICPIFYWVRRVAVGQLEGPEA